MDNRHQIIILKLSNGKEIKAMVPVFCEKGDRVPQVIGFKVIEPQELDKDCYWSIIKGNKDD